MNVFRNAYSAPENRLTYNFLCTIDLMTDGQRDLVQFLLKEKGTELAANPIVEIKALFAFTGGSDPDGCITVRRADGSSLPVFLEVKTKRLALTAEQLERHIKYHVNGKANGLLLVITPRQSDHKIVQGIKDKDDRVSFVSWQDIADYLSKENEGFRGSDRKIIDQFLEHSREEGEFMVTELEEEDIKLIIDSHRRRPEERLQGAFLRLAAEFRFDKYLNLKQDPRWFDEWGERGLELVIEPGRRWIVFGVYYDIEGHRLLFKEGVPELVLFVDTADPGLKDRLRDTLDFVEALSRLRAQGWEDNLTDQSICHLLYWREPLSEFKKLNCEALAGFLEARLKELMAEPAFLQNYARPT